MNDTRTWTKPKRPADLHAIEELGELIEALKTTALTKKQEQDPIIGIQTAAHAVEELYDVLFTLNRLKNEFFTDEEFTAGKDQYIAKLLRRGIYAKKKDAEKQVRQLEVSTLGAPIGGWK